MKASTGIGCGIVAGGAIYRGADGAAGELGHVRAPRAEGLRCTCGNTGCLEAVAGGRAIAAAIEVAGGGGPERVAGVRDVVARLQASDRVAGEVVRQAGRDIGDVLASVVNFLNPRVVVFGGDVADASEDLIAGVREIVYQRAMPLATRDLTIVHGTAGARAGIVGAAVMAIEHFLAPAAIDETLVALSG